jgi:putative addiction module component (TIGR02574 family)
MSGAFVETVKALPLQDRLQLIEELWNTIDADDLPAPAAEEIL